MASTLLPIFLLPILICCSVPNANAMLLLYHNEYSMSCAGKPIVIDQQLLLNQTGIEVRRSPVTVETHIQELYLQNNSLQYLKLERCPNGHSDLSLNRSSTYLFTSYQIILMRRFDALIAWRKAVFALAEYAAPDCIPPITQSLSSAIAKCRRTTLVRILHLSLALDLQP